MKWLQIRIKTITEATDLIILSLYDIGLEGAQIEDKQPLTALEKEQMFVDILPDQTHDDGIAYLYFYVEVCPINELRVRIENELIELKQFTDIGEASITITETDDEDWINNWKKYFTSFTVDNILVVPSWEEVPESGNWKYILRIDPGTAFGTGKHETTQLCIRQLNKYIKKDDILLDIGCGSGILMILALMFGAKKAYGTDLDPCALEAVNQNTNANNISEELYMVTIGNIITDESIIGLIGGEESIDIVVTNILTEVLVLLTPIACRCLKKGGLFITSGILNEKSETIIKTMEDNQMKIIEVNSQGDWTSITSCK